jgi:hypothetical protein
MKKEEESDDIEAAMKIGTVSAGGKLKPDEKEGAREERHKSRRKEGK